MGRTTSVPSRARADATLLQMVLDRGSDVPLNRQLYLLLRELILAGRLTDGTRLPSTRQLADDLGVSRTVTLIAYDQLVAEGYVDARRGSGQYVRALGRPAPQFLSGDPATAQPLPWPSATRGRPFDPVTPPADLFPTAQWTQSMARGWRREGASAVAGEHWGGLPSLRSAVAGHLRAMQGLDCGGEHVAITAGNDDALQLIVRALGLAGAEAWVEDPGYVGSRRTLERAGVATRPVPVDAAGLDVAAGRMLAPRARLVLATPSRQFPLGMPLSLERRIALIDWARSSGAVIVEDDYDSELRFAGRPMASLLGLGLDASVLAIGSLSKLTFPGLRLGYLVGSERLIAQLVAERARQGIPVATAAQPALADFIAEGGFARHLGNMRRAVAARRGALIAAIDAHLAAHVTVLPQEVGMHLTVLLGAAQPGADRRIAEAAAARGLFIDPLSAHAASEEARQGFLLGYAAWDQETLQRSIETLAGLILSRVT